VAIIELKINVNDTIEESLRGFLKKKLGNKQYLEIPRIWAISLNSNPNIIIKLISPITNRVLIVLEISKQLAFELRGNYLEDFWENWWEQFSVSPEYNDFLDELDKFAEVD
jgi:hypothetical protein